MSRQRSWIGLAACLLWPGIAPGIASAQPVTRPEVPAETVLIHAPYVEDFTCTEHYAGQLMRPGDALGADCLVVRLVTMPGDAGAFPMPFTSDGSRNEDWFSHDQAVLAPIDATVERVVTNPDLNQPGTPGEPPAGFVIFRRGDGVRVLIAHVGDVRVRKGDRVTAGQPVARVMNNGFSRSPHVHIGAWRGRNPLQLRIDLTTKGATRVQP